MTSEQQNNVVTDAVAAGIVIRDADEYHPLFRFAELTITRYLREQCEQGSGYRVYKAPVDTQKTSNLIYETF